MPPSPFPARTVEAVETCTRTLACIDGGASLDRANAATLSGLRAFADRLALRQRFHSAAIHHKNRPDDAVAADLYAALELARLDTRGVRWLAGVGRNLLTHPGLDVDAPRWLAFEIFSGQAAPAEKAASVAALRSVLPRRTIEGLTALAALVEDQARFSPAAAAWAAGAASALPKAQAPMAHAKTFPLPTRFSEVHKRRNSTGASGNKKVKRDLTTEDGGGESHLTGNEAGPVSADGPDYQVFTRNYDRVVTASTLATREELAQLRVALDADLSAIRSVVARLAKRLMRVLMAKQQRQWKFDQEEGYIDGSRLASLVATRGRTRPFKVEAESPFPGTVVTLLIDHSGSMRGRPMKIAALTVEIFARVLERCNVRCEVLGFTTRDWNGGEPAKEWAESGYPENPGRLNGLEHIIVKGADVPWRRARIGLGLFMRDEMLKENIDGEALQWAHGRLMARSEPRRILVVISDGTPMDEATMAANGHEYLDRHLQITVQHVEQQSPVQLAAIGIGHNVGYIYENATTIQKVDELGPALTEKLLKLFESPARG
jgi:cobaltochelatase CobT